MALTAPAFHSLSSLGSQYMQFQRCWSDHSFFYIGSALENQNTSEENWLADANR